ncbi:MAG TPA: LytR family transcriptional regulator, partial [Agromyces sp.]
TNDANLGGGVITVEPDADETPTTPSSTPTPGATEAPVDLPDSIPGTSAADRTCSAGNVRADG